MLQKYLPVFLVFLFGVLGCASTETIESTKVAPSEIYQSYLIRASRNGTSVNTTFRVGGPTGSTVDLDAPARVELNGKEMSESKPGFLKGTDYNASFEQFVPVHRFKFTDSSEKVWENEISLDALEITSGEILFSKVGGGSLTISRPVGKDEIVEFSLVSEKTPPAPASNSNTGVKKPEMNYSTNLQVSFDQSGKTGKIDPVALKNFVDGRATISLTVRKSKPAEQSAKGGSMDISYESQKAMVSVGN